MMARCYRLVELIDRRAVPKCSPWAFTFEEGRGAVINNSGSSLNARRGAALWYTNDLDYERAWSDSTTFAGRDALAEFMARHGIT
jgi:hypothetical protein